MVGGSIKSYLLKRVSTVRIRPGAPGNMTASRERRRFWFVICGVLVLGAVFGLCVLSGFGGRRHPRHQFPRGGSFRIRPGAPEEYRARYRYGAGLFWSKGRIRTVDTRVTNFPAGGVFESARGHQRFAEPGTATVPGSFGVRAAPFHASGSHQKQSARLPGEQAGASERMCLRHQPLRATS